MSYVITNIPALHSYGLSEGTRQGRAPVAIVTTCSFRYSVSCRFPVLLPHSLCAAQAHSIFCLRVGHGGMQTRPRLGAPGWQPWWTKGQKQASHTLRLLYYCKWGRNPLDLTMVGYLGSLTTELRNSGGTSWADLSVWLYRATVMLSRYWEPNTISHLNLQTHTHYYSFWLKLLQPRVLRDAAMKTVQAKKITWLLQEDSLASREGTASGRGNL